MLKLRQILVRPLVLAAVAVVGALTLTACGQKGPLYLPTEPAAAQRATLPDLMNPRASTPGTATPVLAAPAPASTASAPAAR